MPLFAAIVFCLLATVAPALAAAQEAAAVPPTPESRDEFGDESGDAAPVEPAPSSGLLGENPIGRPTLELGEMPPVREHSQSVFGQRFDQDALARGFDVQGAAIETKLTVAVESTATRWPWQSAPGFRLLVRPAMELRVVERVFSVFAEGVGSVMADDGREAAHLARFGAKILLGRSFNDYDLFSLHVSGDVPLDNVGRMVIGDVDAVVNVRGAIMSVLPQRFGLRAWAEISRSFGADAYNRFDVAADFIWYAGSIPYFGELLFSLGIEFDIRYPDSQPNRQFYGFRFATESESGFALTIRIRIDGDTPFAWLASLTFRV